MQQKQSFFVLFLLTLVIATSVAVISYLEIYAQRHKFDEKIQEDSRWLHTSFNALVAQTETNMLTTATFIANDREVQNLLYYGRKAFMQHKSTKGIRARLLDKVGLNWKSVQNSFGSRQLHFHLAPNATSFLRVHRPDKFEDDLSDIRHMVMDVNSSLVPRSGIETGRMYTGIRGVVPVLAWDYESGEKVHIGAVDVGTSFRPVLDSLDKSYDVGAGILLNRSQYEARAWVFPEDPKDLFVKGMHDSCNCKTETTSRNNYIDIYKAALLKNIDLSQSGFDYVQYGRHIYALSRFAIRDYQGKKDLSLPPIGSVVFWKDVSEPLAELQKNKIKTIIYAFITFLVLECSMLFAVRYSTRRLQRKISERTEELRRSETKYRYLHENLPIGTVLLDDKGVIKDCNKYVSHIMRRARDALIGQVYYDPTYSLIDENGNHIQFDNLPSRKSLTTGDTFKSVIIGIQYPDSTVWVSVNTLPIFDASSGVPKEVLICFEDVTEQKKAQDALREKEVMYRQIFELNTAVKLMIDPHTGQIINANQAACEFYGYDKSKITTHTIYDISHPSDVAIKQAMEMISHGEKGRFVLKQVLSSGDVRDVELHAALLHVGKKPMIQSIVFDVTQRNAYEARLKVVNQQLAHEKARLADILEATNTGTWELDLAKNQLSLSPISYGMLGYDSAFSSGHNLEYWLDLVHSDDKERTQRAFEHHIRHTDLTMEIEFRMRTHTGAFLWLAIKGRVVEWDQNGQALRMSGTQVDISHKKEQQNQLRLAASVFTNAHEGILITKTDGTIVDCNDAFHRITGYARDEVIGRDPSVLKSGRQSNAFYKNMWQSLQVHGYWAGEVWNRRKNGEVYAEFLTISAVRNQRNEIENYVGIFSDITTTKMHQKELEHLAHYDVLTGLPNRTLLADRLQTAMARAQSTNSMLAVAFLDLDGFKAVNDTYGHERGDDLLREISKRMNAMLHKNDTLARLGGDEFVVLLSNLQDPEDCTPALQDLLAAASAPVFVNDLELTVSASIGVCFYPSHDDIDADQLLRQADQAMYQAKLSGKNRYFVFDPAQDEAVKGHHENLDQIQKALAHQEFILHFQPKVNLRTGHTIGAEALIRWQHPERGLLSPAMFIPTIENHPLSISLGEWVIDAALQQLTDWKALGLNFPISVNITALHLQQNDFANHIHDALGRYPKVPPHQLEIEILETGALQDMERALRNMQACIDLGVRFSIDDFGTGYSSLVYLKKLPISVIKIDQSFIRDILYDCDDLTITNGIIGLAKAYGLPCIAEGVETEIHCEHMLRLGCELVQGYGVARPMSADGFLEWHQTWAPHPAWAHIKSATGLTLLALFAETELRNSMSNSHIMSLHDATQAANVQSIAKWMNGFAMAHPYAAQEQPFILLKSAYDTFQDLSTLTHLPEAQEQVEYQHLCQKMIDLVRQLSERHGDDIKDLVLSP